MANLYRLIIAVALLAYAGVSSAQGQCREYGYFSSIEPAFPTAADACAGRAAYEQNRTGQPYDWRYENDSCVIRQADHPANQWFGAYVYSRVVPCPDPGTEPGSNEHAQSCYTFSGLETLPGGFLVQDQVLSGRVDHGKTFCLPLDGGPAAGGGRGCRIKFNMQMVAGNPDGSSTSYGTFDMDTRPGSTPANGIPDYSCTVGDGTTSDSKPAEPPCKNGSQGSVNGVTVCVPRQPDNGVTTGVDGTETQTKPDGSKTETRTQRETTCNATTCTTTTTVTTTNTSSGGQAGAPTTTTTTTNTPRGEYCKANPKAAQCTGSTGGGGSGGGTGGDGDGDDPSKFGGSCAAGFTCEGDAIQCAIAREQHVRACKLFDDKSPESELYAAEVAKGTQRNVTGDLPGNETIDVASKLNTGNLLGTAQCPGDLNVTVWRTEVALPFSRLCQPLDYMGWILVAVAGIAGFRIVSGTSKES